MYVIQKEEEIEKRQPLGEGRAAPPLPLTTTESEPVTLLPGFLTFVKKYRHLHGSTVCAAVVNPLPRSHRQASLITNSGSQADKRHHSRREISWGPAEMRG